MEQNSVYSKVVYARDFYTDEPTFRQAIKSALDSHDQKIKRLSREYGIRPAKLQKKEVKFSIIPKLRKVVDKPNLLANVRGILADFEHYFEYGCYQKNTLGGVWGKRKSA